jgi:hypothetical protein
MCKSEQFAEDYVVAEKKEFANLSTGNGLKKKASEVG